LLDAVMVKSLHVPFYGWLRPAIKASKKADRLPGEANPPSIFPFVEFTTP
jgi:hypothetical protein